MRDVVPYVASLLLAFALGLQFRGFLRNVRALFGRQEEIEFDFSRRRLSFLFSDPPPESTVSADEDLLFAQIKGRERELDRKIARDLRMMNMRPGELVPVPSGMTLEEFNEEIRRKQGRYPPGF